MLVILVFVGELDDFGFVSLVPAFDVEDEPMTCMEDKDLFRDFLGLEDLIGVVLVTISEDNGSAILFATDCEELFGLSVLDPVELGSTGAEGKLLILPSMMIIDDGIDVVAPSRDIDHLSTEHGLDSEKLL